MSEDVRLQLNRREFFSFLSVAWIAFNTNNKQLCFEAGSEVQSCLEDLS